MKKALLALIVVLSLLSLSGCRFNAPSDPQTSDVSAIGTGAESRELSDDKLAQIVASNLCVPDDASITYEIGEKIFWEVGEVYYKHVTFYENGDIVASASVDPYTGELLKNIYKYEN